MHWLLLRPAIGWGAFLAIHAIGIPIVYALGKACKEKETSDTLIAEAEA